MRLKIRGLTKAMTHGTSQGFRLVNQSLVLLIAQLGHPSSITAPEHLELRKGRPRLFIPFKDNKYNAGKQLSAASISRWITTIVDSVTNNSNNSYDIMDLVYLNQYSENVNCGLPAPSKSFTATPPPPPPRSYLSHVHRARASRPSSRITMINMCFQIWEASLVIFQVYW